MGTRATPLILSVGKAAKENVWALAFSCLCGRRVYVPILLAHWRLGPEMKLETLRRKARCLHCRREAWDVQPVWRPYRPWWKQHHPGPLEADARFDRRRNSNIGPAAKGS